MVVMLNAGNDTLNDEPDAACVPAATDLTEFWPAVDDALMQCKCAMPDALSPANSGRFADLPRLEPQGRQRYDRSGRFRIAGGHDPPVSNASFGGGQLWHQSTFQFQGRSNDEAEIAKRMRFA